MFRFPSLRSDHLAYSVSYHAPSEHGFDVAFVSVSAVRTAIAFATGGDGLIQHGPSRPITTGMLADFSTSLAQALLERPAEYNLWDEMSAAWPRRMLNHDQQRFLSTISSCEHDQWFSVTTTKLSRSRTKHFDKRWMAVPPWADRSLSTTTSLTPLTTTSLARPAAFADPGRSVHGRTAADASAGEGLHAPSGGRADAGGRGGAIGLQRPQR